MLNEPISTSSAANFAATNHPTVEVIGTPLYALNIPTFTNFVIETCLQAPRQNYCISAADAHCLVRCRKEKNFRQVLHSFYLCLPDGMPSVWIGRLKGAKQMDRCYGPETFKSIIAQSASHPTIKHFLCGGKEGVVEELARFCSNELGNEHIVGVNSPPFREMSEEEVKQLAEQINHSGANIVWLGLGSPKQEYFAKRLAQFTQTDFLFTVGAAFDFHTGRVKQAPRWIQRSGFEWLFRLLMEPKRLYKRYFEVIPAFLYYNLTELWQYLWRREKSNKA